MNAEQNGQAFLDPSSEKVKLRPAPAGAEADNAVIRRRPETVLFGFSGSLASRTADGRLDNQDFALAATWGAGLVISDDALPLTRGTILGHETRASSGIHWNKSLMG